MSNNIPQQFQKPIFAYMRRSTTKEQQASSLPQQEEGIEFIAKSLGIPLSEIRSFTESRSGYENRKRPEWKKMIEEIDKLQESCIILCRDTSRLSRNPTDNLVIANRIFGDNKHKKLIESVYFLGTGMVIEEWNIRTNKKHIVDTLHQNYTDSMENKEKCIGGILLKLEQGEFPYRQPHGLSRVNSQGEKLKGRYEKTILKQNDKIVFIRRAFEMKAQGRTAKEICQYLKQYANISISTKNVIETLISNPVYKGQYTEKTTGRFFEGIKFWEGKPPIEKDLWGMANSNIKKRGFGFGELQKEHIAPGILKLETGKPLSLYKAKKKYNAYQTEIPGENGKRKSISFMETRLVKEFLDQAIPKVLDICYHLYGGIDLREHEQYIHSLKKNEVIEFLDEINEWYRDMYTNTGKSIYDFQAKNVGEYIEKIKQEQTHSKEVFFSDSIEKQNKAVDYFEQNLMKDSGPDPEGLEFYEDMMAGVRESLEKKKEAYTTLRKAVTKEEMVQEKKKREEEVGKLLSQKESLEKEKNEVDINALRLGHKESTANGLKEVIQQQINALEKQIQDLSESSDFEQYLDRLPEILKDLHELASKVLSEADYQDSRDEIRQLIQLVSHELTLTTKKELKVKLFEGLENLEILKMGNGRTRSKGYIRLSIYHKMRKRQYGNRWMTQFVPLCRDEVRRLEENNILRQLATDENSVQDYLEDIENGPLHTNSIHGVTL